MDYVEDRFDVFISALNITLNDTLHDVTIEAIQRYFSTHGPQFLMIQMVLTLFSIMGIRMTDIIRRKVTYIIQMVYWKFRGEVEHIARREAPNVETIAKQVDERTTELANRIQNLEYMCNDIGVRPKESDVNENLERCLMMYQLIKKELDSKYASYERRLQDYDWRIAAMASQKIKDKEITIINTNEISSDKHSVHIVADDTNVNDIS
nr:NSP4 [Bat RVJ-like rotavirus BtSY2]